MRQVKCETQEAAISEAQRFIDTGESYAAVIASFGGRYYVENEPPLIRNGERLIKELPEDD